MMDGEEMAVVMMGWGGDGCGDDGMGRRCRAILLMVCYVEEEK